MIKNIPEQQKYKYANDQFIKLVTEAANIQTKQLSEDALIYFDDKLDMKEFVQEYVFKEADRMISVAV